MIEKANKTRKPKNIVFCCDDIIFPQYGMEEYFDIIITDRCLINLVDEQGQLNAISSIYGLLKSGGIYIMCEDTKEGLDRLNDIRKESGLPLIEQRWHNNYIAEDISLEPFDLEKEDNFSSTYYYISRIVYAKQCAISGQEPDYMNSLNKIASELPSVGDYSPLKIFILRKE
jgi:SAM-dependent methyltransferase